MSEKYRERLYRFNVYYSIITSGEHATSSANKHAQNFLQFANLPVTKDFMRTSTGAFKPVLFVGVDGRPDENPMFPKTLGAWLPIFKECDFDGIFMVTYAPGQSAFIVERRMVQLSREMCGLILPHDFLGSHLNTPIVRGKQCKWMTS